MLGPDELVAQQMKSRRQLSRRTVLHAATALGVSAGGVLSHTPHAASNPAPPGPRDRWTATWAAGIAPPADWWVDWGYLLGGFDAQTFRQVVHTSIGGSAVRVTISNYFGTTPLHVGSASVAVSSEAAGSSASVKADTLTALNFRGRTGTVIEPGDIVVSDPADLNVPAEHDLAISIYFPEPTGAPNGHLWAAETSHAGDGDLAMNATGEGYTVDTTSSYHVVAVDVRSESSRGCVVALGDSLTDGILTIGPDSEGRWSDHIVKRLIAVGRLELGVVNVGIAGNALHPLSDPVSALGRLDRDVLSISGATTIIMLLGTNDIGAGRSADELIGGLKQVINRAHAADVRVVGATIPPFGSASDGACESTDDPDPAQEAIRQTVNARIRPGSRDSLRFDAVVDFDAVLRNPADPSRILCAFSFFGNFHPNAEGHRVLGDAVDLATL